MYTESLRSDLPWLVVKSKSFRSRLILGIEQYESASTIGGVLAAGGCDVFITTFDLEHRRSSVLLSDVAQEVDIEKMIWVGTTSFARNLKDALTTVELLHASFGIDIIKLDVRTEDNAPNVADTIEASRRLIRDGIAVLPLIPPDCHVIRQLEDIGCCAVRVMASPVGSGRGIDDERAMQKAIDCASVPVIVECGIGTVTHAVQAMQMGADAVLVNAAVVRAADPIRMATAMRYATLGGRLGSPSPKARSSTTFAP